MPDNWYVFIKHLCGQRVNSDDFDRKCCVTVVNPMILWYDQRVQKIAKEIQLVKPDECDNTFLGMDVFHTEKMVIISIGKFLEGYGAEKLLAHREIFGPDRRKAVMNGRHYNYSKRGLNTFLLFLRFALNILKIFTLLHVISSKFNLLNTILIYNRC